VNSTLCFTMLRASSTSCWWSTIMTMCFFIKN
jgi:hypothetical protein